MKRRHVAFVVALVLVGCAKRKKGSSYDAQLLSAGGSSACAVMKDGRLRCWGAVASEYPDPLPGFTDIQSACVRDRNACAISNGTARCTNGTTIPDVVQVSCERDRICTLGSARKRITCGTYWIDLSLVSSIASGPTTTCAIDEFAVPHCFGSNVDGLVGDGTTAPEGAGSPRLTNVTAISVGAHHACAVTKQELVYCWGRNTHGQLGDGTFTDHLVPEPVSNLAGVDVVAAGAEHTCAHRKDDTIRCWGSDAHHQLGLGGTPQDTPNATLVPGLYEATTVTCGDAFTCARMKDGWLRCWGANEAGQIGDGTKLERQVPVPVKF